MQLYRASWRNVKGIDPGQRCCSVCFLDENQPLVRVMHKV